MDIQYVGNDTYACVYDGVIMMEKNNKVILTSENDHNARGIVLYNKFNTQGRYNLIKRISNIIDFNN